MKKPMISIYLNVLFVCGVLFLNDGLVSRTILCMLQIACACCIGYHYLHQGTCELLESEDRGKRSIFFLVTVFPTISISAYFYFIPDGIALNYFIIAAVIAIFGARILMHKSKDIKEDLIIAICTVIIILAASLKGMPVLYDK